MPTQEEKRELLSLYASDHRININGRSGSVVQFQADMTAVVKRKFPIDHIVEDIQRRKAGSADFAAADAHNPEILVERHVLLPEHGLQARGNSPVFTVLAGSDQLFDLKVSRLAGPGLELSILLVAGVNEHHQSQDGKAGRAEHSHRPSLTPFWRRARLLC